MVRRFSSFAYRQQERWGLFSFFETLKKASRRRKSEAVRTVLAARGYQEKAVPPDVIRRIVEAGRLTGSAINSQPWLLRNRNSQYL